MGRLKFNGPKPKILYDGLSVLHGSIAIIRAPEPQKWRGDRAPPPRRINVTECRALLSAFLRTIPLRTRSCPYNLCGRGGGRHAEGRRRRGANIQDV